MLPDDEKTKRRFITDFDSLIIIIIIKKQSMGCGAMCGNNSSIRQPSQQFLNNVLKLIPQLNLQKDFISEQQFQDFIKSIKQNPLRYRLQNSDKLIAKKEIHPDILTKWKVLLYCLDSSSLYYNNCLGQKVKKSSIIRTDTQHLQVYSNQKTEQIDPQFFSEESIIFRHKQFCQIEKDIDRTCELTNSQKKTFQKILKRITNHFPKMGYTQGINFIVGYFLMLGYSQFDAFWMFVHVAIQKRYLLLGLFEDGFPLSQIYKTIFKAVLKRYNTKLYNHLYDNLGIDESVWVFKWFFTCFIYSFPFEMIKYVFDMIIQIGSIALIKFAVAITQELQKLLMQKYDVCQISIFFQSLRDVNTFNQNLSIHKVIERAYKLQIKKQDFENLKHLKSNFYSEYILANIQEDKTEKEVSLQKIELQNVDSRLNSNANSKQSSEGHMKNEELLKEWYEKLISERMQFKSTHQNTQTKRRVQRISIQNKLNLDLLIKQDEQINDQRSSKSPSQQKQSNSIKNSNKGSYQDSMEIKNATIPSTGCSFNKKSSRLRHDDDVSEIDELWDQEDRNSSISKNLSSKLSQQSRTQNGFDLKLKKPKYEDQLDKMAATQNNALIKSKINNFNKSNSIFTSDKQMSFKPKINNFQVPVTEKLRMTNLMRAGNTIVNQSIMTQKSHNESLVSQNSKFSQKQKKQKQTQICTKNFNANRMKNIKKAYINENDPIILGEKDKSSANNDQNSSSQDSYFDPHNSSICASNDSIQEESKHHEVQAYSMKGFEANKQRISTHQQILITSLHVSQIQEKSHNKIDAQGNDNIELFQAQVFKKKNRVSSRINNGAVNSILIENTKMPKLTHTISEQLIFENPKKNVKTVHGIDLNYQESCESIFDQSQDKRSSTFRAGQQTQKYQNQSVRQ